MKLYTAAKNLLKSEHFQSFVHTLITELLYDAAVAGTVSQVVTGDVTKSALYAVGYAIFRTTIRVIYKELLALFPKEEKSKKVK